MTIAATRRPLPPVPFNERERLNALFDSCLLDSAPDPAFDEITAFASAVMQTPIAVVSLVDQHRQWFKSKVGVDIDQTARADAFCAYAILQREPLIVKDARTDARFSNHPMVTGEPGVRFYFGIPIRSDDGMPLGALAVVDTVPRDLISTVAFAAMQFLAGRVEQLIRAHRSAGYRDRATGLSNQRRFRENAVALYRSTTPETNCGWAVSIEAVSASQSATWIEANQADRIDARARQIGRWIASATAVREGVYRLSARHLGFFIEGSDAPDAPAVQSMLSVLARGLATFASDAFDAEAETEAEAASALDSNSGSDATISSTVLRALPLNAFEDEAALVAAMIGSSALHPIDAIREEVSGRSVIPANPTTSAMASATASPTASDQCVSEDDASTGGLLTAGGVLRWRTRRVLSSDSWSGVDVSWTRAYDGMNGATSIPTNRPTNPLTNSSETEGLALSECDRINITTAVIGLLERFARACVKYGRRDARIHLDLSEAFFFGPEPLQVMEAAVAFGVAPEQVEWTLSVAVLCRAYAQTQARVQMLRRLGAGVVVTGFGAGFDTLGWLPTLPITGVRFDARLTDAVCRDRRHGDVVRRLSSLVHALGGRVSAEELDTADALTVARFLSVDEGSGNAIAQTLKSRRLPDHHVPRNAALPVAPESPISIPPQTPLSIPLQGRPHPWLDTTAIPDSLPSLSQDAAVSAPADTIPTRRPQSIFDAVCRPLTFLSSRFSSLL